LSVPSSAQQRPSERDNDEKRDEQQENPLSVVARLGRGRSARGIGGWFGLTGDGLNCAAFLTATDSTGEGVVEGHEGAAFGAGQFEHAQGLKQV